MAFKASSEMTTEADFNNFFCFFTGDFDGEVLVITWSWHCWGGD
jgi:hypothetical protein